jgi:hypothetical protein
LLTLLDWRCLAPTAEFLSVIDDVANPYHRARGGLVFELTPVRAAGALIKARDASWELSALR